MSNVLVTGANRGIGLELVRLFSARGDTVFAACRQSSEELESTGVRVVDGIDVTDDAAVVSLADSLGQTRLDLLVNNAGMLSRESFDDLDFDGIRRQVEVNALAPLRVTKALLGKLGTRSGADRVDRVARVAMITSLMGSMGDNTSGGYYGYRMSKAALNMAAVSLAHDLKPNGIAVGVFHPGMVATRMTGGRGISVRESAEGLAARMEELTLETSGTFRHADGRELPW